MACSIAAPSTGGGWTDVIRGALCISPGTDTRGVARLPESGKRDAKLVVQVMNTSDDTQFRLLRQLDLRASAQPAAFGQTLGLSLGKVNYCVQALVGKGLIKISNLRRSDNKVAYAYLLTPAGLQEKSRLTVRFLKRKQQEYARLRAEIAELQGEVETLELDPDATRREG